ncbi:hypothetical protein TanjilG_16374 [Lupinus angustifolius]|uniref:Uncharacterized protein n=1 Tax=Lupinus angustifolius TaxID=3871 RepID=A0A1J7I215_LUPAN|nr:PREDICTED: uncharacterized protein LOC109352199 [Lupinus angustifolius]OIW08793.1 hypothetical protein TanjilG_16374 [Lupinus angustifolius]
MKARSNNNNNKKVEGSNWILVAAGALLSTLSIRLGYKLKQALESNPNHNATILHKGNGKSSNSSKSADSFIQSHGYSLTQDNHGCFTCISGTGNTVELKCPSNGQLVSESDGSLPLVTVPTAEFNKENGVIWASSPDRLELPSKPYQSNCSDSPCVSESGSDIFSKREVIQKLRQQLKRRDDMILEMQDQIAELRNSLNAQLGLSSHLQLQLDASNRDLFDSEREIQRLRKVIADHCVGQFQHDKSSLVTAWPAETRNGHANGHLEGEANLELPEKIRDDDERIEMLRKQVGELKEVIEGKEYLLQNYKEQKAELTLKMREMQQRLDSQLPNIL